MYYNFFKLIKKVKTQRQSGPHFLKVVPCPSRPTLIPSTHCLIFILSLIYQEIEKSHPNQKNMTDDTQMDPIVDAVEETEEVSEEAALAEEEATETVDESSAEEAA